MNATMTSIPSNLSAQSLAEQGLARLKQGSQDTSATADIYLNAIAESAASTPAERALAKTANAFAGHLTKADWLKGFQAREFALNVLTRPLNGPIAPILRELSSKFLPQELPTVGRFSRQSTRDRESGLRCGTWALVEGLADSPDPVEARLSAVGSEIKRTLTSEFWDKSRQRYQTMRTLLNMAADPSQGEISKLAQFGTLSNQQLSRGSYYFLEAREVGGVILRAIQVAAVHEPDIALVADAALKRGVHPSREEARNSSIYVNIASHQREAFGIIQKLADAKAEATQPPV